MKREIKERLEDLVNDLGEIKWDCINKGSNEPTSDFYFIEELEGIIKKKLEGEIESQVRFMEGKD